MRVIHKSFGRRQNRFSNMLAVMICTFVTFIAFLFVIFSRLYTGAMENVVQIQRNEVLDSVSDFDFYFNAAINAVTFCGNNMLVLHAQDAAPEDFDGSSLALCMHQTLAPNADAKGASYC